MRSLVFVLLIGVASSATRAEPVSPSAPAVAATAVRPLIGPPEPWVLPAAIPAAPTAGEGAATVKLLSDTQTRFIKDGDTTYHSSVFKIASSKGLDDGSLQLSWDPALETLTIHRYRILRDGQTLDLLGDGTKLSVIRREKNLENATLDGELTATLQPEDLRVGDTIDLAYSRTRRDPATAGNSEFVFGPRDGTPYGRYRVRMIWPKDKDLRWRAYPGVIQPKLSHTALGSELVVDLNNVLAPRGPQGAPSRFRMVNAVEITQFPDWPSVSRVFLPLFENASKLGPDSKVREQAKRIAAQTTDPKRRAELALALVQEQVRYLFLAMDDGGYVPAPADATWARRFGDCKAKTVLLVALLRELGVEARPVLVNTDYGDLVATRLPAMGAFDHVIVEARIAGRSYWLDGTRQGDTSLDRVAVPPYIVALPVAANATGLVPLSPPDLTLPSETISLALDASAGIEAPAPAKGEMRFRGQTATDVRIKYAGLSAIDRDEELRKFWREKYDFITPSAVTSAIDERTGDYVLGMTGSAKMDWFSDSDTRWYELDRARVGWKLDILRDGQLNKDAPFAFEYPDYWESRETITLPRKGAGFRLQGGSVDKAVGGIYAFHRKVAIDGAVLSLEVSTRALAAELPAAKAEQTRSEMAALAATGIYVRVPDDYLPTDGDLAALKNDKPGLAKALVQRGAVEFDNGSADASLADANAALANDPTVALAHSIRALILADRGDATAAAAADRALALDSKQWLAWRAKGLLAIAQDKWADADTAFTTGLALNDKDDRALVGRGTARIMLDRYADALGDFDLLAAMSSELSVHHLRALALSGLGRSDEALGEINRGMQSEPQNPNMRAMRSEILTSLGRREEAIADLDALIGGKPKAEYYLERADLWTTADHAKRDADVAAALRLNPRSVRALGMRASTAIEAGNYRAAEVDIAAIEKIDPASRLPASLRSDSFQKQGRPRDALRMADADVAKHPKDATALNERCWLKATLNIEIASALTDCDAALKLEPDRADILDSRAFANLRLGQVDAAIADYDAALKIAPKLPASLFGRAIARARKGETAAARADLAEAQKLNPGIEARFADYGIQIPPSLAAK